MLWRGVSSLTKLFFASSLLILCMNCMFSRVSSLLFDMSIVVMFFNRRQASSGIFLIKLYDRFKISRLFGRIHKSWILLLHRLSLLRKCRPLSSWTDSYNIFPDKSNSVRFLKSDISLIYVALRFTNLNDISFWGFLTSESFCTGAAGKVEVEELKLLPWLPEPADPIRPNIPLL